MATKEEFEEGLEEFVAPGVTGWHKGADDDGLRIQACFYPTMCVIRITDIKSATKDGWNKIEIPLDAVIASKITESIKSLLKARGE